ncbi:hypothetical protein CGRA01v4_08086 [Colletotrichum graminicola]|nr:hypothetical protein CGRA01v4_08086 [Colletotrichum graminicola]
MGFGIWAYGTVNSITGYLVLESHWPHPHHHPPWCSAYRLPFSDLFHTYSTPALSLKPAASAGSLSRSIALCAPQGAYRWPCIVITVPTRPHPLPNRNRAAWKTYVLRKLTRCPHATHARAASDEGPACRAAYISCFSPCVSFSDSMT